ncbi:MAG: Fe-S protein assembly chaperone HscA [Planctomycetes bacterium]|nr:Fe-S protein assembly chaperone HscA [Planctomycetota bacterium]
MAYIPLDVLGQQSEPVLGIDLGTTNSLAAIWRDGRPVVLAPEGGDAIVPSAIYFPPTGLPVIGKRAREHALTDADRVLFSVKRLMGRGLDDVRDDLRTVPFPTRESERKLVQVVVDGKPYTPQELSALILRAVQYNAARALGGQALRRAVITVPAYFDDTQRQATRDAARLAGLDCLRILNEPTAASLAYGLDQRKEGTIAVYDLGGGTFDVSILTIEDGVFRVLSTNGDTHLGGDDFDQALAARVLAELGAAIDEDTRRDPAFLQALRLTCERTKMQLSRDPQAELSLVVPELGLHWRQRIVRQEFESLIEPLIQRSLDCCKRALVDAKLEPVSIDEVVLVGGSTRVPAVRAAVERLFGRKPHTELNPDEVVALGAAVQGHILAGGTRDILLMDVTPLSLGLETMGGAVEKVIPRNSPIPCQHTSGFTTWADNQTGIDFNVVQGERELARNCRSLGRFKLGGLPPLPAGLPRVAVRFQIDADGILSVTAKEESTGATAGIDVNPMHGLTDAEVEHMLKMSFENAREDFDARRRADLRTEIGTMLKAIDKQLPAVRAQLDKETLLDLEDAIRAARAAETNEHTSEVQQARDQLEKASLPLAAVLMDNFARGALKGKALQDL